MPPDGPPALEGTLVACSHPRSDLHACITDEYADLVDRVGAKNVLVLQRHPSGLERLERTLVEADTIHTPRLEALPEHASKVLEEYDPTLERLEYEERIELISLVIAGASRDVPPYLERASDHDGFARDVGRLLLEATRQRIDSTTIDPDTHSCLAYLYAMNDRFHDELEARGFIERASVIPRVVDLLEADADGLRERVTASFDAVLAVQFEEFRRLDRHYLAALTADADLVCVGQRHASVERTRVEPGSLESIATGVGLECRPPARETGPETPHRTITELLATGSPPVDEQDPSGTAYRIRAETARDQATQVAREIESLCVREGWSYDEVAVAVPRAERIPPTRRWLRDAGVPTATVGTPSLADDPAVSELYAVIEAQCTLDRGRSTADLEEVVVDRLAARVPDFSPTTLETCRDRSVTTTLERWLEVTNLKGRIARDEPWVDAREQFESVRRVLEIARFVEQTDLVAPDWQGLRRMLQRTIEYDAPHVHTIETATTGGGVSVCPIDDLATDTREAVFVLDLTDDNYPGTQFLTPLFPQAWLRSMPAFPAVTNPTPVELEETFATVRADEAVADPFERYHAERSRRKLALASRAARCHLCLCSYERETDGLRRTHEESRFVRELDASPVVELEDVDPPDTRGRIHGRQRTLEAILGTPWNDLETLRRRTSIGEVASLSDSEEWMQEIALALETVGGDRDAGGWAEDAAGDDDGTVEGGNDRVAGGCVDEELRQAIETQFEFAAGEVRR
ncbi:hypothetical protein [Natronosalvus vescus]|uniref:hypothetical protein n=1 Tax=Natronosalvus vescus TaxID=2953881 RepID=UPI0020904C58|nr:hypothetical protein [Natronosalvus vescus]